MRPLLNAKLPTSLPASEIMSIWKTAGRLLAQNAEALSEIGTDDDETLCRFAGSNRQHS